MANLMKKTGTVTGTGETVSINTSLSKIKAFSIYRGTMDSTGLLLACYDETNGFQYTYCSGYSDAIKYVSYSSSGYSVNNGTVAVSSSIASANLASGKEYTWIAYGEE